MCSTPLPERENKPAAIQQEAGTYRGAKGKNANGHQLGLGLKDIGATHMS